MSGKPLTANSIRSVISGDIDYRQSETVPEWARLSPTVANALHDLAAESDKWSRYPTRADARLSTNHISVERSALYELNDFERELEISLDVLVWISAHPLGDLRYEELVQPVGRVRRPARLAAQHLVSHSEQWERWEPDAPVPREILAAVREDEYDLYENRVARTLINGARRHVDERLRRLNSYLAKSRAGRLVLLSGWHWRQERLKVAFDKQNAEVAIFMLEDAVDRLTGVRDALEAGERSRLYRETPSRTRVQVLNVTNVLRRDNHYRHVPPLWQLWKKAADDDELGEPKDEDDHLLLLGLQILTEVLIAKALHWLGFRHDAGLYRLGTCEIRLLNNTGEVSVQITDPAGGRSVRFLPIKDPLITPMGPDPLMNARRLHELLRGRVDSSERLAIVHPADAGDLDALDRSDVDFVDQPGVDSVDPAVGWATIPASPLLVDSLERMTRVARWHVWAPLFGVYPPSIDVGSLSAGQRALISQIDFLRYDGRSLFVVEPPRLDDVERLLRSRDFASFHHNVRFADLQHASRLFDDLLRCPVYPTHGSALTQFRQRDKGAWLCRCASCRSEWGLSTCGACGYRIPFVKPGVPVADGERPSDFFGGDLLASLCEGAPAADVLPVDGGPDGRVLICPQCRACGRSDKYPACERCAGRALTVKEPQTEPRVR